MQLKTVFLDCNHIHLIVMEFLTVKIFLNFCNTPVFVFWNVDRGSFILLMKMKSNNLQKVVYH